MDTLGKHSSILLTLLLLSLMACLVSCTGEQVMPPLKGEISDLAEAFTTKLAAGDFPGAAGYFDANMKEQVSDRYLLKFWEQLEKQMGSFKNKIGIQADEFHEYDTVLVTMEFEEALLDMRLVFDADRRIAGFQLLPAKDYCPPAYSEPANFKEREVTMGDDPWSLPGTLTVPSTQGPHPAVVLVHGSGPNDRDETVSANKPFKDLAWGLANRGIAVLRYEKRTLEHKIGMAVLADSITPKEETTDDAAAAVNLLQSQPEINADRIYVLGHSLGGTLAPRIASATDLAGIIILAGSTRPLEDLYLEQIEFLTYLYGIPTPKEEENLQNVRKQVARVKDPNLSGDTPARELPMGIPASYWLYLLDYSPVQTAQTLNIPMLILQGERDYQVTMEDFAGWREALSDRHDVTFISYPFLNHLFIAGKGQPNPLEYLRSDNVAEDVVDDISSWILDN